MDLQLGNAKCVYKHFGFLVEECGMNLSIDLLPNTSGVEDPTYVYSFYNDNGCFSLKEVAQRSEWDCYVSEMFSVNVRDRMDKRIDQCSYFEFPVFTVRAFLKLTASEIKTQLRKSRCFWGIHV